MQHSSETKVFSISKWRAALAALGYAAATIGFAFVGVDFPDYTEQSYWIIGIAATCALGTARTLHNAFNRSQLTLSQYGLEWNGQFHNWTNIQSYWGLKFNGGRYISVILEGSEKATMPAPSGFIARIKYLFKANDLEIDVSYFPASNDAIEEAMDAYYFPARGIDPDSPEE